jgi:alkylation response protein AidB-like acyl-CoA dehydrogenase
MNATQSYQVRLEQVCSETIAAAAPAVDRGAAFPEQSIAALKAAGLLGAVSAPEVGGLGLGVRGAVEIVGRVAQECGSTADGRLHALQRDRRAGGFRH